VGLNASIRVGGSGSAAAQSSFSFGASANLGTKIEGAFNAGGGAGINIHNNAAPSLQPSSATETKGPAVKLDMGVGFE
jgi:hypothetical protein